MAQNEPQYSGPGRAFQRLLIVFLASAVAVFGLLFQQMWTHSRGFDVYAFDYWGPRALGVAVVTTIIGLSVVNRSWKVRSLFGVFVGLSVSFLFVWINN